MSLTRTSTSFWGCLGLQVRITRLTSISGHLPCDAFGADVSCTIPLPHPLIRCQVVTAKSFRATCAHERTDEIGLCFLRAVAMNESSPTNLSSDPLVVRLLDEFTDIFESPTGVVPDRSISYEIILEAGVVPPKGCIYRMSEEELAVLRTQLDDLLDKSWIRPSISPLSEKIQAIQEWSDPRNVTDVCSFLGLAGYYQRFIKGYSKIAAHLTKLQCEDRSFDFREDARESFLALKVVLLSAELLRIYDPLLPTRVTTDASGYGIGAVLEQHDGVDWHPAEYFTKKEPVVHSIDDARKKELLAFVHSLKRWRHFLLGRSQFLWVTDNNPLVFYKTQDTVNGTIARWMAFIDQFDFFLDHIPGKFNRFADALSRRPDHCTAVYSTFEIDDDLRDSFIRGYQADTEFRDKYAFCSSPNPMPSHYQIQEGYLPVHTWGKDLLCVPTPGPFTPCDEDDVCWVCIVTLVGLVIGILAFRYAVLYYVRECMPRLTRSQTKTMDRKEGESLLAYEEHLAAFIQEANNRAAAAAKERGRIEQEEEAKRQKEEQDRLRQEEADLQAIAEHWSRQRERLFTRETVIGDEAAHWVQVASTDEAPETEKGLSALAQVSHDLVATCVLQQEEILHLQQTVDQMLARLQALEKQPAVVAAAGPSNLATRVQVLKDDVSNIKRVHQDFRTSQQATNVQLETQVQAAATVTPAAASSRCPPKLDGIPVFCDQSKTEPISWWRQFTLRLDMHHVPNNDRHPCLYHQSGGACQAWLDNILTSHGVAVSKLHTKLTWQELTDAWHKRFQVEPPDLQAMDKLNKLHQNTLLSQDWITEFQRLASIPDPPLTFRAIKHSFIMRSCPALQNVLTQIAETLDTSDKLFSTASRIILTNIEARNAGRSFMTTSGTQPKPKFSPLTPRGRELLELQQVERIRLKLERELKQATDRENKIKQRAARLETLEADKAELDESVLSDQMKVLKNNMLSLHAHVDNRLDFMQNTLDQILDILQRPGFRPPAQSPLPLTAMFGPFPVQAGTQPSGTSAAAAQTVASSSSGPAVGATPPQQPVPQQGQPQGQWYPKTPMKPPLAFSGERKDEELNTWLRTVPVWVKAKRTLPEDEVDTAASYLEGKTAKWLDGIVAKAGYGRRMADWAQSITLDQFFEMVEARWHNPQQAQIATDAINRLDQRKFKSVRELTTTIESLIVIPGINYSDQFMLTTFVRCLPENLRNLLASEARLEYHSFKTLFRKALDLETTLGNTQPSQNDARKKKSPQEWKKKGAKLMLVESDGTQTEIDKLTNLLDGSEYDGEKTAEGSTLAAVVKAKAGGRVKGPPKSQGKAASNQTKVADWVTTGLDQDVWRDRRVRGACISCALEDLESEWSNKDPRESWVALRKGPRGEHFVVEVDVGGRKCGAFIDIGSTRNYISRDCLEIKDVVCTFSSGGGKLNHKISFLVSDDLPFDMLLGMYYLEVAKPQFDWDKKVLKHKLPDGRTVRLTKFKASSIIDTYGCLCASAFYNYYKQNQEEGMYLVYVSKKGEAIKTPPEIERVVAKFPDLFEEPTGVVEREVVHAIEIIPGSKTPKERIYRMAPAELDELRRQLKEPTKKGWIWPSTSPYGSPVLFVPKKGGTLRMCIDYGGRNAITVKNTEPLPRIDDLLDRVQGCKYYSKIDLKSGYHQIAIRPEDQHKTTFQTRYGLYEFVVMPFGLCNASGTFQHAMNRIFHDHLDKFVVVYLDDILIFSKSAEEHAQHVETVRSLLRQHKYKVNLEKYWSDECEGAFKRLKHALMNHEVFMVLDPQKPFIVTTDASQYGIGAVLAQQDGKKLRPLEYMSKKMPSKKLAKSTYERELYALYKALVHWRHFLLGRFFYLRTDHHTLKWIKTHPALSDALKRWIEVIDQYDFKLKYLKGEYNKVADALLRRVDYLGAQVSDFGVSEEVTQSLVGAYQEDPVTMDIMRKLQAKDKATESEFVMVDGLLYLDKAGVKRLIVPSNERLRSLFLGECHDATRHFGYKKTSVNLVQRFWWPGMLDDAKKYVETCQVCQRDKPRTQAPLGLMKPLPIPAGPRQSVSMDFMDTLVTSKSGKRHIFIIIDRFTKYARLVAMPETARTDHVIKLFQDNWVGDFGLPKTIVSDRDVRFTSELWKKTAEQMGSQLQMTSRNHPEANGQAEQMNRVVQHLLRHYSTC
ncbi:hypothetical protein CBR_g31485 [Chara braunii]|uniref:RNA-directed DNA polymerase n=1 Tax=Chara braunii TaxID=69332 RepID=A0A388LF35_CHABU|nr:hypothetical protein CBR_g31485 [Chara braunii]|eukprot:GBG80929.1 hypothetical protein CBR_g31485 [Chara braunii]